MNKNTELTKEDSSAIEVESPFVKLLCHCTEKGIANKLYLSTTFEGKLAQEALLDTTVGITLMSSELFKILQTIARSSCKDVKLLPCSL